MSPACLINCDKISIHAPREGGDPTALEKVSLLILFQSTPPARGATPLFLWGG